MKTDFGGVKTVWEPVFTPRACSLRHHPLQHADASAARNMLPWLCRPSVAGEGLAAMLRLRGLHDLLALLPQRGGNARARRVRVGTAVACGHLGPPP